MSRKKHRSKHLDKMVLYLFGVVFLTSVSTMAYKYKNFVRCNLVTFAFDASELRVGELVQFRDHTEGAEIWAWDFGDGSENDNRKTAIHSFDEAGEYKVKLTINEFCERVETITVLPKEIIKDPSKYPVFSIPKSIRVGQTLRVIDETENASTWEWRFGDNASVDAKTQTAEYVYSEPGLRTVRLVVNGNIDYVGTALIEVKPPFNQTGSSFIKDKPKQYESSIKDKPKESSIKEGLKSSIKKTPEEKEREVPFISNSAFGKKLVQIAKEQIQPQAFKDYFCGDLEKGVVVNGKSTTFLEFCAKIKGKKRLKVKEVNIVRADDNSNCITNVVIEHKKLGLF
ncbi:PKD domain-containing protein [Aureitalea sp. L0-47]|uniref:PKD domain-containing protein n=1 Tax=Aureitalea sp. L0-47 TaxID=2816962 RepID=UPI002238FD05|nr:PKD domain-containing protein [Aureitalea sp. L0-47]MCW5518539.1 PKD domain-containing protein [Aureitalea sp. L0-47]